MKAKLSLVTLGVGDLDRSLTFYRDGLGLPTETYDPAAGVVCFRMEPGYRSYLSGSRRRGD